ncbi:hypothetical protein OG887_26880 [Streptomyces sp. NBC_00053]|uniref:DUF3558 family protein n=1 Tax=unclassified Streptomyces TaxID=2593676 RepID=UPI000F5BF4EA|nr:MULTISPECIES: DUF3558 family protein [unclassified Streptomyces]WSG53159.1 hypothetical protein OHA38_27115 [Streptomyces sp. NBC_01732]WSX03811.1 hypothetical protein OG355_27210 [Streptomyces sp. NBC_00987]MCX4394157.1 hypothetical protein [Streptomyces sp. NBC_01767]MCX5106106.1 hypothetical protein [Streptomyces sp. NBC_00439]MCX5162749.1 hypothetical protein [Streptomyces sp. NBC_00305]
MRGRDLLIACIALMTVGGALTACSSEPPPPAPRPSGIAQIKACDFFTKDELDEYQLHDAARLTSSADCMWQGTKFFEGASTALVLTLRDSSADKVLAALGTSAGEKFSERPAVDGRRVWRNTTPGTDVSCALLFEIDGSSSAELKLSEFLGVSDVEPTQQDLCKGLDELAPRVEGKLPAVRG